MSADLMIDADREDGEGNTRQYTIIGTYVVVYKVLLPDGGETNDFPPDTDETTVQRWIDDDHQEWLDQHADERDDENEEGDEE
jgi:hypothetical protein